jgi:hypothetical protein
MKFLVSTCPAPGERPLPSGEAFDAQTQWFRKHIASGVIEAAHHAPDRAVFVFNADSQAALAALMDKIPLAEQMARVIEPLTDFWEHADRVSAYLHRAAAKASAAP